MRRPEVSELIIEACGNSARMHWFVPEHARKLLRFAAPAGTARVLVTLAPLRGRAACSCRPAGARYALVLVDVCA